MLAEKSVTRVYLDSNVTFAVTVYVVSSSSPLYEAEISLLALSSSIATTLRLITPIELLPRRRMSLTPIKSLVLLRSVRAACASAVSTSDELSPALVAIAVITISVLPFVTTASRVLPPIEVFETILSKAVFESQMEIFNELPSEPGYLAMNAASVGTVTSFS